MRLLILLPLLGVLTSCLGTSGTTKLSSGGAGPIAPGTPIRWPASTLAAPLDIDTSQDFVDDFVPADLDGDGHHPIDQMAKQWNNSHSGLTFLKVPSDTVSNVAYADVANFKDASMGIYKSFTWFPNVSSSALAITQFYGIRRNVGSTSEYVELHHADIIVNYRDYDFSTNSGSSFDYDLHSVILHELGHLLGLPHNWDWDNPSVMEPFLSISESKRTVTATDKANIVDLYSSGSSLTAKNTSGFASFSPVPGEGEPVSGMFELRTDGKCHHTINGEKVLVH